jgi:hypothetical protein
MHFENLDKFGVLGDIDWEGLALFPKVLREALVGAVFHNVFGQTSFQLVGKELHHSATLESN